MILGREDLKPFKAWFQKTLPLVYDDSLTYQELLYKLIAKLTKSLNRRIKRMKILMNCMHCLYS